MRLLLIVLMLPGSLARAEGLSATFERPQFWNKNWERATTELIQSIRHGLTMIDENHQSPGEATVKRVGRGFAEINRLGQGITRKRFFSRTRVRHIDGLIQSVFDEAFAESGRCFAPKHLRQRFIADIRAELQSDQLRQHKKDLERIWRADSEASAWAWTQAVGGPTTVGVVAGLIARWLHLDPFTVDQIAIGTALTLGTGSYLIYDKLPITRRFRLGRNIISHKAFECADALIEDDPGPAPRGPIVLSAGRLGRRTGGPVGRVRDRRGRPGTY